MFIYRLLHKEHLLSSDKYLKWLRDKGIKIGKGFRTFSTRDVHIDTTRPELVEIGENVMINRGFKLLTHDIVTHVMRNVYHDFVATTGKVKIGNNVVFGMDCTVCKGVTIGDNVFVGIGSLVTKDIPSNCIAAGRPARPICTLDEYHAKRLAEQEEKAFEWVKALRDAGKTPTYKDMTGEFELFVDSSNIADYPGLNIKYELQSNYDMWLATHKAKYSSFEEFLAAADKANNG